MNELLSLLDKYFVSIPLLVGLIVVVSEGIDKYWDLEGIKSWIRSWVIAIILCLMGAYFNIGIFADEGLWPWFAEGPFCGILLGLAANGLFSIPGVTKVLEFIKVREKPV